MTTIVVVFFYVLLFDGQDMDRYLFSFFLVCFLLLFSLLATESQAQWTGAFVHSRNQLIALSKPLLLPRANPEIPKEFWRRRWGCRTGAKLKAKRRKHKPSVPAILMGNVRSLANKTDKLVVLVKTQREYRESSVICFMETWLNSHFPGPQRSRTRL